MGRVSLGRSSLILSVLTLSVLLGLSAAIVNAGSPIEIYVYGLPGSSSLEKIREYFGGRTDSTISIYYLNDSRRMSEFLDLVEVLATQGINVVPSEICTPCELSQGSSWQKIYLEYSSPLVLLFRNNRLTSIMIASSSLKFLDQASTNSGDTVQVFLRDRAVASIDEESRTQIELMFNKGAVKPKVDLLKVLPLIVLAASADAVNPCEFYVLIVFLSLIVHRLGRGAVLKAGAAYSAAIFAVYFVMGLGIIRLIGYVQEAKILVAALGFILGLRSVLNFIFSSSSGRKSPLSGLSRGKLRCVPEFFSRRIFDRLGRVSKNPLSAFAVGLVTGLFLLPCTSGPYLIALSMISDLETQLHGVLLLILYNGIVVAPFLAITIGIHQLRLRTSGLKRWSLNRRRWLSLTGGLIMMALSLYLLITIL
jgi:cytochrome c biogenesis protein CcdA